MLFWSSYAVTPLQICPIAVLYVAAAAFATLEATAAERVVAEHGVAAGRDIRDTTITIGFTFEQVQGLIQAGTQELKTTYQAQVEELSQRLAVTQDAVIGFFAILKREQVPPDKLTETLAVIAQRHREMLKRLALLDPEDPAIKALIDEARTVLKESDYDRADVLLHQAEVAELAAARQAQALAQQAQAAARRWLNAAATRAERGEISLTRLKYWEAAAHFKAASEIVPAEEAVSRAKYLNYEGAAWMAAGQYAEAQPPLERALALREKALGPEHPEVAQSLNHLAELYRAQGRYADAEPRFQWALALYEKGLGPEQREVARGLTNLAALYYTQGRYADAEPLCQRALALLEKGLGLEHHEVARVGKNYAALLRATNRDAEAAQLEARWQAPQSPHVWLGIQMKRSTDPPGLFVEQVIAESPAAHAGIQPHDVIIRFNAHEVHDPQTLLRLLGLAAIGTTIDIEIIHNGKKNTIPVTLGKRPVSKP